MYLYKVTHLPTRDFYIAVSFEGKRSFNGTVNTDPVGQFRSLGDNGTRLKIANCEKRFLQELASQEELEMVVAKMVRLYENNSSFKGLFGGGSMSTAPKDSKPVSAPSTTKPKSSGTSSKASSASDS